LDNTSNFKEALHESPAGAVAGAICKYKNACLPGMIATNLRSSMRVQRKSERLPCGQQQNKSITKLAAFHQACAQKSIEQLTLRASASGGHTSHPWGISTKDPLEVKQRLTPVRRIIVIMQYDSSSNRRTQVFIVTTTTQSPFT
jgi:hypothetical protein